MLGTPQSAVEPGKGSEDTPSQCGAGDEKVGGGVQREELVVIDKRTHPTKKLSR